MVLADKDTSMEDVLIALTTRELMVFIMNNAVLIFAICKLKSCWLVESASLAQHAQPQVQMEDSVQLEVTGLLQAALFHTAHQFPIVQVTRLLTISINAWLVSALTIQMHQEETAYSQAIISCSQATMWCHLIVIIVQFGMDSIVWVVESMNIQTSQELFAFLIKPHLNKLYAMLIHRFILLMVSLALTALLTLGHSIIS